MISPSDIRNKKFERSMKGYRMESVDEFIDQIAESMAALIEENHNLESKINILAEKIEEYRSDEDSLRDALLGAQKLGATVIRESKAKADGIIREAALKAERINAENQKQVERERTALVKMQREVTTFRARMMSMYKQHLELINSLPVFEEEPPEKIETLEDVKNFVENGSAKPKAEPAPKQTAPKEEKPAAPAPKEGDTIKFNVPTEKAPEDVRKAMENADKSMEKAAAAQSAAESRFGPLRFGEGYELKRDNK